MKDLRLIDALSPTMDAIIENLRIGATRTAAVGAAGISRETFYVWLKENLTFSDAVTQAEAQAEIGHTLALAKASASDWRASESWLKRRRRADWGDNIAVGADKEAARILAELFPENAGGNNEPLTDGASESFDAVRE